MCMGCVPGPWTDSDQFVLFYSLYSFFGPSLYTASCATQKCSYMVTQIVRQIDRWGMFNAKNYILLPVVVTCY